MAYLNANIPVQYAQVRKEYLYDLKSHHGEVEDCVIFGLASLAGKAVLFHCLLPNGAIYYRLPISAFIQRAYDILQVPRMRLDELELWDSFSYYPAITVFDFLAGQECKYLGKDKKFYTGEYLFTIDWAHPEPNILDVDHSEIPQEHKCGHFIALDNGNYAIQPNNRILWHVGNFTTKNEWPDYKTQTSEWSVENKDWTTDDTDRMFYDIIKKK
tara:strand:+ start:43 stop:684 length:642 start_codon:yes stop_codon:yes gene_type:complete